MTPRGPAALAADAVLARIPRARDQRSTDEREDARERAEAEGIITAVHGYCAEHCSRRSRCAQERCNLWRHERDAKDTLARLDAAEATSYLEAMPTDPLTGTPLL